MNNPYPAYKPSGISWIGDVPEHWQARRGKCYIPQMEPRHVREAPMRSSLSYRDGTVTLRKNRRTGGFTESLKETGYQGIRQGPIN